MLPQFKFFRRAGACVNLFRKPPVAVESTSSEHVQVGRPLLRVVETRETEFSHDAVLLPTEEVTLLRVPLPLATHRQRQSAVSYAVEDMIAEPLEAIHVALGPELAPGEYLVAVLGRRTMATWAAKTDTVRKRLVPDVMALPVPGPGGLSVREVAGRVLARRANGTGFATRRDAFETFWRAEGRPQIVLLGGRLPDTLPVSTADMTAVPGTPEGGSFDLMQGEWAKGYTSGRKFVPRLALVVGIAFAAHLLVLGAKTVALQRIATEREAELRAELAVRVPGLPEDTPLDVALQRALPSGPETVGAGFVPLAARVSEALLPTVGAISVRSMTFTAEDGSLSILVEGPDLETLQQVESSLAAAGLMVEVGVATTSADMAEVRYVIGGAGG
jgi:general secretion pathway protein L